MCEGDKTASATATCGDSPYLYDAVFNVTKSCCEICQTMTESNNMTSSAGAAAIPTASGGGGGTYMCPCAGGGIPYKIPFGVGIVGTVAKTGQTINISDANQVGLKTSNSAYSRRHCWK